jgi:hypothetical protein
MVAYESNHICISTGVFPFLIEGRQHVHKLTFHICSENDPRREDNVSKKIASGFAIRLPQLIMIRKPLLCRPISQLPFIYFFLKSTGVNKCNYYFPLIEKNSRCYFLPDSTYPYLDSNHLFNLLMQSLTNYIPHTSWLVSFPQAWRFDSGLFNCCKEGSEIEMQLGSQQSYTSTPSVPNWLTHLFFHNKRTYKMKHV